MSNRQELEREIAALENDRDSLFDAVAMVGGSAPVTGPDPRALLESTIAKLKDRKSQLRALDD
jgi:hypothetical protein